MNPRRYARELAAHPIPVTAFLVIWVLTWVVLAARWNYGLPGPLFVIHLFLPSFIAGAVVGAWRKYDAPGGGVAPSLRGGMLAGVAANVLNFLAMLLWGSLWIQFNPLPVESGPGETWFSLLLELPFWVGLYALPGLIAGLAGALFGTWFAGKVVGDPDAPDPGMPAP